MNGRTRKRMFVVVVAVAAAAVVAAVAAATAPAPARKTSAASLSRVSSNGVPVTLTARDQRGLARMSRARAGTQLGDVTLIATRGGRRYYRVATTTGVGCYAVGPAAATDHQLAQIQCAPDFPSPARPVLDFTVVHGGTADVGADRIFRSEGIAADGVADIAFRTPSGRLVGVTPVVGNVYSVHAPAAERVNELVVRGADGQALKTYWISRARP